MHQPVRKSIRLPRDAYREPGFTWLVTIVTADRQPRFTNLSLGGAVLALFLDDAPNRGLDLHLACLMPDHGHLLVSLTVGDLVAAIGALKSRSTKVFRGFGFEGALWQRSFHDQGIRGAPAFHEVVQYVLCNPVVAGLSKTWEEYDLIAGSWVGRS